MLVAIVCVNVELLVVRVGRVGASNEIGHIAAAAAVASPSSFVAIYQFGWFPPAIGVCVYARNRRNRRKRRKQQDQLPTTFIPFNNIHSLTIETSFTVFARDDVGFKMISSIVSIHSVSYCSTEAVAAGVSILQIKAVDAVLGLIDKQQTFTVVAQRQSFQYIL